MEIEHVVKQNLENKEKIKELLTNKNLGMIRKILIWSIEKELTEEELSNLYSKSIDVSKHLYIFWRNSSGQSVPYPYQLIYNYIYKNDDKYENAEEFFIDLLISNYSGTELVKMTLENQKFLNSFKENVNSYLRSESKNKEFKYIFKENGTTDLIYEISENKD